MTKLTIKMRETIVKKLDLAAVGLTRGRALLDCGSSVQGARRCSEE